MFSIPFVALAVLAAGGWFTAFLWWRTSKNWKRAAETWQSVADLKKKRYASERRLDSQLRVARLMSYGPLKDES